LHESEIPNPVGDPDIEKKIRRIKFKQKPEDD